MAEGIFSGSFIPESADKKKWANSKERGEGKLGLCGEGGGVVIAAIFAIER